MRLRLLRKVLLVAAVAFVTPVWAQPGHGHGHGPRHDAPRHGWNGHRHGFDWRHHPHYAYGWRNPYPVYYGSGYYAPGYYAPGYYYPPYPPYGYAAARPGIQIVVPNIYIPLR